MSDFPVTPTFDNVYVKKDDASQDPDSKFFLPDTVKGRAQTGTVLTVGPGYLDLITGKFIPTTLKAGDRILVKEFDGYIMTYYSKNGAEHKFFVFKEKDIIGRLNEGE